MNNMPKYKDIPRFTRSPSASNHSDIPLNFLESWIDDKIKDLNLQLCPDFQRGHVWTKEQKIAYIEYLLRGGKSGREIYFNHPGWMHNWKGEFVLVDGLQRITACLAFIHNEIPAFGYYAREYDDLRMADVYLSFWVNDLKTKSEVLTWYIEMNSGGTPHTLQELDRVKAMLQQDKHNEH